MAERGPSSGSDTEDSVVLFEVPYHGEDCLTGFEEDNTEEDGNKNSGETVANNGKDVVVNNGQDVVAINGEGVENVANNGEDVANNMEDIANNGEDIANNGEDVANNGENVANNGEDVANNGEDVANNGEDVANNGEDVGHCGVYFDDSEEDDYVYSGFRYSPDDEHFDPYQTGPVQSHANTVLPDVEEGTIPFSLHQDIVQKLRTALANSRSMKTETSDPVRSSSPRNATNSPTYQHGTHFPQRVLPFRRRRTYFYQPVAAFRQLGRGFQTVGVEHYSIRRRNLSRMRVLTEIRQTTLSTRGNHFFVTVFWAFLWALSLFLASLFVRM